MLCDPLRDNLALSALLNVQTSETCNSICTSKSKVDGFNFIQEVLLWMVSAGGVAAAEHFCCITREICGGLSWHQLYDEFQKWQCYLDIYLRNREIINF